MNIKQAALALPFLFMISLSAKADESVFESLYRRESSVNTMSWDLHRYETARNQVADELVKDVAVYEDRAKAWVQRYLDFARNLKTMDYSELDSYIAQEIRGQANEREDLSVLTGKLRAKLQSSKTDLAKSHPFTSEEISAEKVALDSARAKFLQRIEGLLQVIAKHESELDKIEKAFSADLFILRYRTAAVRSGIDSGSPLVQKFSEFIRAETFARGLLAKANLKSISVSLEMLNLRGQRLKILVPDLKETCESSAAKVQASDYPQDQKARILTELGGYCDKVLKDYESTILSYSTDRIAKAMQKQSIRKFRDVCNLASKRCDLYKQLSQITPERAARYSDEAIAALEDSWFELEGTAR